MNMNTKFVGVTMIRNAASRAAPNKCFGVGRVLQNCTLVAALLLAMWVLLHNSECRSRVIVGSYKLKIGMQAPLKDSGDSPTSTALRVLALPLTHTHYWRRTVLRPRGTKTR
ncbi:unnamed protein product [Amoebophrya sp. A25]|nr:unnamed protein product [Amoebophrya sp. A25]|eukprot:GSA25T00000691001.1